MAAALVTTTTVPPPAPPVIANNRTTITKDAIDELFSLFEKRDGWGSGSFPITTVLEKDAEYMAISNKYNLHRSQSAGQYTKWKKCHGISIISPLEAATSLWDKRIKDNGK
jgi:hypothetical protein